MSAVEGVPTIRSLDEWNNFVAQNPDTPALLQCGSPVCTRCKPFTDRINQLKQAFTFRHAYVNTHDAEEDLLEELQVAKLPAFRIVRAASGENYRMTQTQNATTDDLTKAVQTTCSTALSFGDDDF